MGHLAIASAVLLGALGSVVAQQWLHFMFPDSVAVTTFAALLNVAILSTLVSLHLSLSAALPRRRRWRSSVIAAAVVLVIGAVFAMADQEPFSDVPVFSSVIKPLSPRWVPTNSVEEFADMSRALKEQVDAMAARK
jgi:hypothetical protein